MIWSLLVAGLAVSLPILMAVRFRGPSFWAILLTDSLFVALLYATRRGLLGLASYAIPSILLTLVSFVVATSVEGVRDVAIIVYPVVIALAGFLAGSRALFAFTIFVIAAFALLSAAEIYGMIVNQFSANTRTQDIVVFSAICIMFALLLRHALRYLLETCISRKSMNVS